MNDQVFTPKQLSKLFGVTTQTLKEWEREGKIKAIKTEGGHRRYIHSILEVSDPKTSKRKFIYARVSSSKQKHDLQRQIDALQARYPDYETIQDVGSGINFKRRGLITLLEQIIGRNVSHVVVAHRDRLTRFGFELFEYLFERFGVSFEVMSDDDVKEPITELAKDLLSIVTVFTARYYGSRSYSVHKENKILPHSRTKGSPKQMHRRVKVLLQQNNKYSQRKRSERLIEERSSTSIGDAK